MSIGARKNQEPAATIYRITDVPMTFSVVATIIITSVVVCFGLATADSVNSSVAPGLYELLIMSICFSIFVSVLSILRLRAIFGGYVIDVENGKFQFPGGGISPNSVGAVFNSDFFLQYFRRFTILYDEIRQIHIGCDRKQSIFNDKFYYSHWIKINGNFGAVKLTFASEGKRDELYSTFIVENKMGVPIRMQN